MSPAHQELTPTEALVLLEPNKASAWSAVRTSLLHLAAAGYLRGEAQTKRSWLGTGGGTFLARGAAAGQPADHLAVVLNALFPAGKPEKPLSSTEVTHRLQGAFGYDYGRYLARHVRPLLVTKALLEVEDYRWMGIIPRRRYRHTAAGERQRAQLGARLQRAEGVPELLQRDPRAAAAAATSLGGLVLVAEGLRPHLGALAHAARLEPVGLIATLDAHEEERRSDWLDAADLFTQVDWAAVLDVVDGLGDAFDGGGSADGGDGGGGE